MTNPTPRDQTGATATAPPKYPAVITERVLTINAHIPDAEIERDIADTQEEIVKLMAQRHAEQEIAANSLNEHERRLASFKASARPSQIQERQEFVAFLRRLLAARTSNHALSEPQR